LSSTLLVRTIIALNSITKITDISQTAFDNPSARAAKVQPDSTSFLGGAGSGSQQNSSKRLLWSISFYQQFFDVDTNQILARCRAALYPRQNFLDVLEGNPDLYGPFWIATTVVVILFLTGTINQYLASTGKEHFAYDFRLLSGAAGLIYGYTLFIPLGLWGVLKWFGSESANLMECWALYGYANLIWIPVALVSWSPLAGKFLQLLGLLLELNSDLILTALNYAFVGVGLAMSAVFLSRNLYVHTSCSSHPRVLSVLIFKQIPSRLCYRCKAIPHSADCRRCLTRWSGHCDQNLVLRGWFSGLGCARYAFRSHARCSQGRRWWRQQDVLLGGMLVRDTLYCSVCIYHTRAFDWLFTFPQYTNIPCLYVSFG
jgi:hypothetical protein